MRRAGAAVAQARAWGAEPLRAEVGKAGEEEWGEAWPSLRASKGVPRGARRHPPRRPYGRSEDIRWPRDSVGNCRRGRASWGRPSHRPI